MWCRGACTAHLEVDLWGHTEPQHVLTPLSHRLDVEQMLGSNVGGHTGGAPAATAQGQGGVQVEVVEVTCRMWMSAGKTKV